MVFPHRCCVRYERVLELNRNDQMVDVLSFEGWLEPNEMSLLSAILNPAFRPESIEGNCRNT